MTTAETSWGSDGVVSLPKELESTDTHRIDVGGGFCFTPDGLQPSLSRTDKDELLGRGFGPQRGR